METRKQKFIREFEEAIKNSATKYVVAVKLPTGATELIINTEQIETKKEYCDKSYDDDLKLNTCQDIQIVSYMFC